MAAGGATIDLEVDEMRGRAAGLARQAARRIDVTEARCAAHRAQPTQPSREAGRQRPHDLHA
jgi:hypothetical protein